MLAAGTYRGRLGGQVYQDEDGSTGLSGVYADAGQTSGQYGPARTAVFGRTKLMYTLRQQQTQRERDLVRYSQAQAREQFSTGMHPVAKAAVGVGLGGIAGALLAAALL